MDADKHYFINNPVFVKYKKRFDIAQFKAVTHLKTVFVNERIVEIPFALESLNGLSRDKRVLDLGCTESVLPLYVAGLGYKVTGFDFRHYPYIHPNLEFVRGDILQLPFADESFDVVFAISTIEHMGIGFYDDPVLVREADQRAVAEAHRVLKKEGTMTITVPFGVAAMNDHQRIYDEAALGTLLAKFTVREKRYFRNVTDVRRQGNFWQQTDFGEAATIRSQRTTNGVCLVRAAK